MAKTAGVALVTGASRGIGPFIARSLAEAGYSLVLTGRSASELEALADDLKAKGTTAVALPADLTVTEDVETLARTAEREVSRVDVLVNNAGGDPQREFDDMTWAENDAIFQLNVIAPMRLTHLLLPGMLERRRGHIVNISSIAGRVGFPYTEAYAAAKDGLMGFTRVLRNDYRSRGVSASVVVLGAIRDAGQGQRIADQLGMSTRTVQRWLNAYLERGPDGLAPRKAPGAKSKIPAALAGLALTFPGTSTAARPAASRRSICSATSARAATTSARAASVRVPTRSSPSSSRRSATGRSAP